MTETNHAVPAFRVETGSRASRIAGALVLLLLVAGCSMPFWAEPARLRGLAEFFYVLALAQMWNPLAGYGGMVSIGQQAFVGIGGYTLVVLGLHAGLNPCAAAMAAASSPACWRCPPAACCSACAAPISPSAAGWWRKCSGWSSPTSPRWAAARACR